MDTDDLNVIRTHYLHRVLSHVKQKFIRVTFITRKVSLCFMLWWVNLKLFFNQNNQSFYRRHLFSGSEMRTARLPPRHNWAGRSKIKTRLLFKITFKKKFKSYLHRKHPFTLLIFLKVVSEIILKRFFLENKVFSIRFPFTFYDYFIF